MKKSRAILADKGVRLIGMRCAGYNNVNLKSACDHGIPVVRMPQYSPYAVAEYTLGLLMALNRKIPRAFNRVRDGNFSLNGLLGFDLHGKTIGIIGTGKIGRTFAGLLRGFGMKILASAPHTNLAAAKEIPMEYAPLETLFRECDILSLHCPITLKNTHLVNASSIAAMKKGVILLNTSYGKLVDSAARWWMGRKAAKSTEQDWMSTRKRANTSLKTALTSWCRMIFWRGSRLSPT